MTTTTSYGTWNNHGNRTWLTVEDSVTEALGDFADDYDIDAIASDYRDAINAGLPEGVSLCGDEFYGPYPRPEGDLGIREVIKDVAEVDFWEIVARHDHTA